MNITEQEYYKKLESYGLSFYEEHGYCTSCLYGVDEPCECESLKKKYQEFNDEVDKS